MYGNRHVDLGCACRRISQGKYSNAGQTCIAPDYALVHSSIKDRFVAEMKKTIVEQFGEDPSSCPSYGRIINSMHWDRVSKLLSRKAGKVLHGGQSDKATRYIAPTMVDMGSVAAGNGKAGEALASGLMTEEIFGPVLPIVTVDSMAEAIAFVNARPKPLAAYVFSSDSSTTRSVVQQTTSGSCCVNDAMFQYLNNNLPFGGVGNSGIGAYHGHASFLEFSHSKSVLEHSTFFDLLPPYNLRYAPVRSPALPTLSSPFLLLALSCRTIAQATAAVLDSAWLCVCACACACRLCSTRTSPGCARCSIC